jgi:hypothetical protein
LNRQPTPAELIAALNDPDPDNPLAAAIAETLARYTDHLSKQVLQDKAWPDLLLLPAPATEIEAFALELFTRDIAAVGVRVRIKGDS